MLRRPLQAAAAAAAAAPVAAITTAAAAAPAAPDAANWLSCLSARPAHLLVGRPITADYFNRQEIVADGITGNDFYWFVLLLKVVMR